MHRATSAERGSVSFFDVAMHEHTLTQRRLHLEAAQALAEAPVRDA